ncbi:hypothetical protein HYPSUDRAFT_911536 [Hypholoma sublateritium FD-334 SS-4]|uniref:Uncharacterized protein n=1 Tax=Hypholoma sublateritium (strain FD-334 SS-4) TaxID=945553 RepID=A0A0D2PFJ9_HYPSF|nr:hypothetical protein HYPSUDRAFT_911536 [Hypholoma sublateritium FD-334 SS-4]
MRRPSPPCICGRTRLIQLLATLSSTYASKTLLTILREVAQSDTKLMEMHASRLPATSWGRARVDAQRMAK